MKLSTLFLTGLASANEKKFPRVIQSQDSTAWLNSRLKFSTLTLSTSQRSGP